MRQSSSQTDKILRERSAEAEQRSSERHLFSESAEILDVGAGTRSTARVADISVEGCYVDTINPLAVGTLVRVKICREDAEFISAGAVRNAQPGMGMGIAFAEVSDTGRALLQKWVAERQWSSLSPANSDPLAQDPEPPEYQETLARRLIELLHKKRLLSDGDVAVLLRDRIL